GTLPHLRGPSEPAATERRSRYTLVKGLVHLPFYSRPGVFETGMGPARSVGRPRRSHWASERVRSTLPTRSATRLYNIEPTVAKPVSSTMFRAPITPV